MELIPLISDLSLEVKNYIAIFKPFCKYRNYLQTY